MTAHVRVGGTPRLIRSIHVRVGGVTRTVREGWVRVGGVARRFFVALSTISSAVAANDLTKAGIGGTGTARLTFNSSGTSSAVVTGTAPAWLLDGNASEVEVRFDQTSSGGGTFSSNPSLGSYGAMTSNRSVEYSDTNNDSAWVGTYTFREIATGTVLGTGTVTLNVAAAP